MKVTLAGPLADAWAMAKADRELLLPVAGIAFFLPLLALLLLMPEIPPLPLDPEMADAARLAMQEKVAQWVLSYGGWYLLASLIVQLGSLIVLILYLHDDKPDLGAALARSVRLFPRFLPAMIVAGLPLGVGQLVLLLLVPGLYLFGRLIVVGPALVAEQPAGLRRAFARSWALTRGNGLMVAALAGVAVLGGGLAAMPFIAIDRSMRAAGMANPVVMLILDGAAAAVSAAAMLAMALLQVAIYRRLTSIRGI